MKLGLFDAFLHKTKESIKKKTLGRRTERLSVKVDEVRKSVISMRCSDMYEIHV